MTHSTQQFADQATETAENAIRATQRSLNGSLDQAAPIINRVASEAEELARRGINAMRDRSEQVRSSALRVSDNAVNSIKDEPIKAVLIAAAAGAALVFLGSLLSRRP